MFVEWPVGCSWIPWSDHRGARRQLEDRIRELERQLGRKTLEAEILREALDKSRSKKPTLLARSPLADDFR